MGSDNLLARLGLTREGVLELLSPEVREEAMRLWRAQGVVDCDVYSDSIYGLVDDHGLHNVRLKLVGDRLVSMCTCNSDARLCPHVGALLLSCVDGVGLSMEERVLRDLLRDVVSGKSLIEGYRASLSEQTIQELRAIAKEHGIVVKSTRKKEIVNALVGYLGAPGRMRSIILSLDDLAQELLVHLHLVLSFGYGMAAEQIMEQWSTLREDVSANALRGQLSRLHRLGLLLAFRQDGETFYSLPHLVRVNLPPQPQMLPYSDREPAQVRTLSPAVILQKLYAFWNVLAAGNAAGKEPVFRIRAAPQRHPAEDELPQLRNWRHLRSEVERLVGERRTISGLYGVAMTIPPAPYHLRSSDRKTMRKHIRCTDEEIEFFCALLEFLGMIRGGPGEAIVLDTDRFRRFIKAPPALQLKFLSAIWLEIRGWSEVDIVLRATDEIRLRRNLVYFSYEPVHLYQEWAGGREAVYRFLYLLREGSWVSLDRFLRLVYDVLPDLFHSMSEPGVWWIESVRSKRQFGTDFDDWRQGFGRFVTAILEGPMYWLGMLDLGYDGEKLQAIRLTPVGSYIIGRRTDFASSVSVTGSRGAVQLGEDMTLSLSPATAPAQLHELLHRIGRLDKITSDRFLYRITAEGVIAEIERGRKPDDLIALLQKLCGTEIPDAWKEQMRTWARNYGLLHLYDDISLIELADDYALHELKINTSLSEHIVHQFSPRLIAVRPDAIDTLIQEMEKKGYTPRVV